MGSETGSACIILLVPEHDKQRVPKNNWGRTTERSHGRMPHEKNKGQKQVLLGSLIQLCNSGTVWGKRTLGSDTLPPEEMRPSMVFSAHTGSFGPTEPPELRRPVLCHLHAFPFILNQAKLSWPRASLLGAGEAINPAGSPTALGKWRLLEA